MELAFSFTTSHLNVTTPTFPDSTYPDQAAGKHTDCMELPPDTINPCDHADSLIARALRLIVDDVLYVGLLPFMTVVGVVVNVINMAVFVTQGLGDRVNLCLFSLSLADILALTSLSARYMSKTLIYVISPTWAYNVWMTSLMKYRLLYIHAGFQLVINLISIVIAVDRWVGVTWPLHAARVLSTRKTCLVIVVAGVLVFAGNQVVSFKYDVRCVHIKGVVSRPLLYAVPSQLYKSHPMLMEILDSFVFSSLVPTISLFITAAATIMTIVKVRRSASWRYSITGRGSADVINQREKAMTSMLVVISCVYIACVSPRVVRAWCRFFIPEFRGWGQLCSLVLLTEAIMNGLLAINSTLNFFVYYVMGSRFRSTLRYLMTCFGLRQPEKKDTI